MSDFLLTSDGDLDFSTGNLVLNREINQVAANKIDKELEFFKGSWFLDTTKGTPWYQEVLGIKNIDLAIPRRIVEETILAVENVAKVTDLTVELDPVTRLLSGSFKAKLTDGTTVEGAI